MRIGVIGGGVVGQATARAWLEHVDEVRVHDLDPRRSTHNQGDTVGGTDIVFVCLPEGNLDAFFSVAKCWARQNFVIRSTVPIGTTRKLRDKYGLTNLCHSPEFLTARCAITDAQLPARNIIGVPNVEEYGDIPIKPLPNVVELLRGLYTKRFSGVTTLWMSSDESEAVKLITNAFFAVKIGFMNEARSLCDKLSLDWNAVLTGVLSDGRISHSHTKVPGSDGYGFSGRCLPKDLDQLIQCFADAFDAETFSPILNAVSKRNAWDRSRKS